MKPEAPGPFRDAFELFGADPVLTTRLRSAANTCIRTKPRATPALRGLQGRPRQRGGDLPLQPDSAIRTNRCRLTDDRQPARSRSGRDRRSTARFGLMRSPAGSCPGRSARRSTGSRITRSRAADSRSTGNSRRSYATRSRYSRTKALSSLNRRSSSPSSAPPAPALKRSSTTPCSASSWGQPRRHGREETRLALAQLQARRATALLGLRLPRSRAEWRRSSRPNPPARAPDRTSASA
jgi:hypothetical protein